MSAPRGMRLQLTQANADDLMAITTLWNRDRKARGLPPLTVDKTLSFILKVARRLAQEGLWVRI